MNTVNANELIAAGVSFQMQNQDTPFDERTGELVGYTEVGRRSDFDVEAELHAARVVLEEAQFLADNPGDECGDAELDAEVAEMAEAATELLAAIDGADGDHANRYFSSSEGLADTTELSVGYWQAVAESHLAEMKRERHLATPKKGDLDPLHGTMEFWAKQREARFDRLRVTAKRLAKAKNWSKLDRLKAGVNERYSASAKLIAERNQKEWFLLYLTSAQVSYLRQV